MPDIDSKRQCRAFVIYKMVINWVEIGNAYANRILYSISRVKFYLLMGLVFSASQAFALSLHIGETVSKTCL